MELFDQLYSLSYPEFAKNQAGTEDLMHELEKSLSLNLPDDYKKLLLMSNGGSIHGSGSVFNYEPIEYLEGHNLSEFFKAGIPDMLVIGDDGGGCIYFYDPTNELKKGKWAIFYVSMGALFLKESVYLAETLTELIENILTGGNFGDLLFKKK